MRFTEKSLQNLDYTKINKESQSLIKSYIDSYPNITDSFCSFSGNTYLGNLLFNYIVDKIFDKIKTKCYRFTSIWDEGTANISNEDLELLLIDHLQFSLMTPYQKQQFVEVVDSLIPLTKTIFLNITRAKELNDLPDSIQDMLQFSQFNIRIPE
jgi:hypothetical protein